jgi:hypothetical protein
MPRSLNLLTHHDGHVLCTNPALRFRRAGCGSGETASVVSETYLLWLVWYCEKAPTTDVVFCHPLFLIFRVGKQVCELPGAAGTVHRSERNQPSALDELFYIRSIGLAWHLPVLQRVPLAVQRVACTASIQSRLEYNVRKIKIFDCHPSFHLSASDPFG